MVKGTRKEEGKYSELIDQLLAAHGEERDRIQTEIVTIGARLVPILVKTLPNYPVTSFRRAVINTILRIGENAVEPLLSLLDEEDKSIRLETVDILGELASSKSTKHLVSMLNDGDEGVRQAAADALLKLSSSTDVTEETFDYLIQQSETVKLDSEVVSSLLCQLNGVQPTIERLLRAAADAVESDNRMGSRKMLEVAEQSAKRTVIVDTFQKLIGRGDVKEDTARELWLEFGGFSEERRRILDVSFGFIMQVESKGLEDWQTMISRANQAFSVTLWMGIFIFFVGLLMIAFSLYIAYLIVIAKVDNVAIWLGTSLTGLIGGLASVLLAFYRGPADRIKQSVTDLAKINVVFMAFMNRIGQISSTFRSLFLEGNIGLSELKETNKLISNIMDDASKLLSVADDKVDTISENAQ